MHRSHASALNFAQTSAQQEKACHIMQPTFCVLLLQPSFTQPSHSSHSRPADPVHHTALECGTCLLLLLLTGAVYHSSRT